MSQWAFKQKESLIELIKIDAFDTCRGRENEEINTYLNVYLNVSIVYKDNAIKWEQSIKKKLFFFNKKNCWINNCINDD